MIQSLLCDISSHRIREMRGNLTQGEPPSNIRRRHRKRNRIQSVDAGAGWRSVMMAGACNHDEICQRQQIAPTVPACDFGESIRADDEIRLFAAGPDPLDSVDRVTFLIAFFQARCAEAWICLAGKFGHPISVFVAGAALAGFMRRMGGRDEPDLIELKLVGRFTRHGEMGIVNRVECSSEERESHLAVRFDRSLTVTAQNQH